MKKPNTDAWINLARNTYPRPFTVTGLSVRGERALRNRATSSNWSGDALELRGGDWRIVAK